MHKFSFFYEIFLHQIIYIQATLYVIKHIMHTFLNSVQNKVRNKIKTNFILVYLDNPHIFVNIIYIGNFFNSKCLDNST